MTKKKGLTFREHVNAGIELMLANRIIQRWATKFGNSYPRSDFAYKYLCRAEKALGLARAGADSSLFKDCPQDANTRIYFLGAESDKVIAQVAGLWTLEHSQYSEDLGKYPFHIENIERTCENNLKDCIHNHRKDNKWQLIFAGTFEDCSKLLDELWEKKGLSND